MTNLGLLLLQLASTNGPALPDKPADPMSRKDCRPDMRDIVVCARDKDAYRLPKTGPSMEEPTLPKAEWKLFGDTKMDVHGEQRTLPNGMSAPAAMVRITIPF